MVVIRPRSLKEIYELVSDELNDFYEKKAVEEYRKIVIKAFVGYTAEDNPANFNKTVNEKQQQNIRNAIRDLKKYKPIDYVLGFKNICGHSFIINENTSIPSDDTSEFVSFMNKETLKDYFYKTKRQYKILDVGTGCGCIAISMKKALMKAKVIGFDIHDATIETAKENNKKIHGEVKFIKADIFDKKSLSSLEKFDLIVSNPPSIPITERVNSEFAAHFHEPEDALYVKGDNHLVFYEEIIDFAKTNLFDEGKLYLEVEEENVRHIRELMKTNGFKRLNIIKNHIEKTIGISGIFELEEEISEKEIFES